MKLAIASASKNAPHILEKLGIIDEFDAIADPLPPVGVWAVSQSQCGRSVSQLGYASLPW